MSTFDPKDVGQQARISTLINKLGDGDWQVRKDTVDQLCQIPSESVAAQMLAILGNSHCDLSRVNAAIEILTKIDFDVVPALLQLLADSDAEVRAYVALALGGHGDPRAIPALIRTLSDLNVNVQVQAIESLGKLQSFEAVDALLQIVDSQRVEVAFPALIALVAIGDERVVPSFLPLLENPICAAAAIDGLGELGDEQSVKPLLRSLEHDGPLAGQIALAIQCIHDRLRERFGNHWGAEALARQVARPPSIAALRKAIDESSPSESVAIVSTLDWLVGDEFNVDLMRWVQNPALRGTCIELLARRGRSTIPDLVYGYDLLDREGRLALLDLFGRFGDARAMPLLLEAIDSDEQEFQVAALDSMARIGDGRLYDIATRFLGDARLRVRTAAVAAINSLGDPRSTADMQRLLRDSSAFLRESAVIVSAYLGLTECNEALLQCCEDADERVRRATIEHLPCLDDPRVLQCLVHALQSGPPQHRASAAGALGEIQSEAVEGLLRDALTDTHVWVRYYAIRSLSHFSLSSPTVMRLAQLAEADDGMQVRIAAIEVLGRYGTLSAGTLIRLTRDTESDPAKAALLALGVTGSLKALPTLILALNSQKLESRSAAIQALAMINLAEAVEPLRRIGLGHDDLLANEAIAALGRLPFEHTVFALLEIAGIPKRRKLVISTLRGLGLLVIPPLARSLLQLPVDVRRSGLAAVIPLQSQEVDSILTTALADSQPGVRQMAQTALAARSLAYALKPPAMHWDAR